MPYPLEIELGVKKKKESKVTFLISATPSTWESGGCIPCIIFIITTTSVVLIIVLSVIKSLITINITITFIIFTYTYFLVPLLFVLFFLYMSWFAINPYFHCCHDYHYYYCFYYPIHQFLNPFLCFVFSYYFWLNDSFSLMKRLRLVNCFVCLFPVSWAEIVG